MAYFRRTCADCGCEFIATDERRVRCDGCAAYGKDGGEPKTSFVPPSEWNPETDPDFRPWREDPESRERGSLAS